MHSSGRAAGADRQPKHAHVGDDGVEWSVRPGGGSLDGFLPPESVQGVADLSKVWLWLTCPRCG